MTAITPKQALEFLDRLKIIREAETDELRKTSMVTKFSQISTLFGSRHLFEVDPDRQRRIDEVRGRWAKIRQAMNV